jgi:hypothetical protein
MQRTGLALLALGLTLFGFLIGWMQDRTPLLIAADALIIAIGALLVGGNLAAARLGAWCIAFAAPTLIAGMVLPPLLQPLELSASLVTNRPFRLMELVAFQLALLFGTISVYRRLRAPQILAARAALGRATAAPWTGLVIGTAFLFLTFYATHRELDEFDVLRAREMAEAQHGTELSYYVSALRYRDGQVHADVTAYGDGRLFSFEVHWTPRAPDE